MTIMGQINVRSRTGILSGQPTRKLSLEGRAASFKGGKEAVYVNNLSRTGMLLETSAPLAVGEPLQVLLPEGDSCSAIVVWANETVFACEFERTLPVSTISRIRLQTPPEKLLIQGSKALHRAASSEEVMGERIKRLRRERGFSMIHFATCVGVSKPTLWKWEKGAVLPRQDMLTIIARVLGVTETELVYGSTSQMSRREQPASNAFAATEDAITAKKAEIADIMGVTADRIRILIEA